MAERTRKRDDRQQTDGQVTDGIESRVVNIRRTTKVVKGGRKFSFSAMVVVGDSRGKVGYGSGKAKEVSGAIQKATEAARRNMVRIPIKDGTLYHPTMARHGATKVFLQPAQRGSGVIAGGATRRVFEVSGVTDVSAKIISGSNPGNIVRATVNGLTSIRTPEQIAEKRGKTVGEILGKSDEQEQPAS